VSRFLLVSLTIEAILQEVTISRRREKLDTMTSGSGLEGAYDTVIKQIKEQKGDRADLGMTALMWVSHSERPLNVDDLCHALAVKIGSRDIDVDNVPLIWTVLSCCRGLLAVDEGSSTIRLIHFTFKEYLSSRMDLFGRAHSKIAETCLTYLNFQAIKDLSTHCSPDRPLDRSLDPRGIPFLRYSSLYWGTHMRIELSDCSKCLALELLDRYDNHISAELLWESINEWSLCSHIDSGKPFSALHCVSYFGIAGVVIDLIGMKKWDVNQRDSAGLTPLMWAAKCGREEVVELLLRRNHAEPDITDAQYDRTALSWAARSGHEEVVKLFLGQLFVNPGSIGQWWRGTPQVMSLLFGRRYINPDRPDKDGQTPLSQAAGNGHYRVVKLLLERGDVSPDKPETRHGQTPLSLAAGNGHGGVVELMLGREDINPNMPDNGGQTPLSWAAGNGHEGVVKLMLGREDTNPDKPDNGGQTPLSWAAWNGHDGVVKLLLEQENVSPDWPDNRGKAPLSWAVGNGHGGVVKLLLGREDVNPDRLDNRGRTPFVLAILHRHEGIVRLFEARKAAAHSVV